VVGEDRVVVVATGVVVDGIDVGAVEVGPLLVVQATTRKNARRESFLIPI
jgi:hypothetical protein